MKLELSVSKRYVSRTSGSTEEVVFAVVDLDKAGSYPLNFVCLLPKKIERECKPSNKFLKIYGKESSLIAIELLTNALRSENDLKVRSEIEKRLKALQPKPITRAKCISCGCIFEPEKVGHFLQRMCQTCRSKNKSSQ
jgi:uncharacterized OB-fold protein